MSGKYRPAVEPQPTGHLAVNSVSVSSYRPAHSLHCRAVLSPRLSCGTARSSLDKEKAAPREAARVKSHKGNAMMRLGQAPGKATREKRRPPTRDGPSSAHSADPTPDSRGAGARQGYGVGGRPPPAYCSVIQYAAVRILEQRREHRLPRLGNRVAAFDGAEAKAVHQLRCCPRHQTVSPRL